MKDWTSVHTAGIDLLVHSGWEPISEEPLRYGSSNGRLDARIVEQHELIDPARVSAVTDSLAESYSDVSVDMVQVQGRAAVKSAFVEDGTRILTYDIALDALFREEEVIFPELRLVYALLPELRSAEAALSKGLETTTREFLKALEGHPRTADDHLSFGPIVIPVDFGLLREDGGIERFPAVDDPTRTIDVGGGGFIYLSDGEGQGLTFGPTVFGGPMDRESLSVFLRDAHAKLFDQSVKTEIDSIDVVKTNFVSSNVGRYSLKLKSWQPEAVRLGYVFRDLLGYAWELTFTLRVDQVAKWSPLIRSMEV